MLPRPPHFYSILYCRQYGFVGYCSRRFWVPSECVRCRDRCIDSDSSWIIAKRGSFRKLFAKIFVFQSSYTKHVGCKRKGHWQAVGGSSQVAKSDIARPCERQYIRSTAFIGARHVAKQGQNSVHSHYRRGQEPATFSGPEREAVHRLHGRDSGALLCFGA